jgi:hypothetical protein
MKFQSQVWGLGVFSGVILSAVLSAAPTAVRASSLADDVTGELYQMKSVYAAEYAPAAWKKAYTSYDLDAQFDIAIAAVKANPNLTQKDAREIFKNFVYAMKDYHTSISFVSTEKATLPFTVKGTDTQFFIMYIDRTKLTEAAFPFHVGDELVTFDGVPTVQAVAAVQAEIPPAIPTTDKALAEVFLTSRAGTRGLNVPQGPVTIGVKRNGTSETVNFELVWNYTPEEVSPRQDLGSAPAPFPLNNPTPAHLDSEFVAVQPAVHLVHPKMDVKLADAPSGTSPYDIGGRMTFTPNLGTPIWTSADSDIFYAYIFKGTDGKLYSYLRLPQYEVDKDAYTAAVAEFARDMALFDSTTEALVVDQVNNPGGSVNYAYALASMLATQPLLTPKHMMSITQTDVSQALQTIDQLTPVTDDASAVKVVGTADTDGYPVSFEFAQFTLNYSHFIVNQWNMGRKLTEPYFLGGVDHINPAATHYSKPIVLLINHLDFSGGDFFPTILQDNKRVVVMGSRTAGAGGYVNDITVANNVGVNSYRCTESIAERVSTNPIENLGVTPDVAYEMTANDFANGYVDYVKAIQTELSSLSSAVRK